MATDPTPNETEGSPEESRDDSASRPPGPPRPPRPGKRSKGSGRISIPLPQSRAELGPVETDASLADPMDAAPGVDFAAAEREEREQPPFPLVAARAKVPSAPEESFADVYGEIANDRASNTPAAPWRGVPSIQADPVEITPPRGTPIRFDRNDENDSEPEPTIVGKVPDNLLELSGGQEENTRAFTAPRELIELAKRTRDEGEKGRSLAPREEHARETARPPGDDGRSDLSVPAAPNVPADSLLPVDMDYEAAPPVKRTASGEMDAAALPSRWAADSLPVASSLSDIDVAPVSEFSHQASANLASEPVPNAFRRSSKRGWLITFGLFVLVGVVIARWRDLVVLFR
jgi:hypothetical protein